MKRALYLLIACLLASCGKDDQPLTATPTFGSHFWSKVNDKTTNQSRDGAALVPLGQNLYLLGGWHPNISPITNNDVYLFTQNLKQTIRLNNAPWEGRHTFGHAFDKDTVFVYGGDLMKGHYQTDSWKGVRQGDTISWTLMNSRVPWGERVVYGSTIHEGNLYVIGGQYNYAEPAGSPGDVWRSTDDGLTWTKTADGIKEFKQNLSGTSVSAFGYIWVIGGGTYYQDEPEKNSHTRQVLRSRDGRTWEKMPDAPFPGRQYPSVLVHQGKIFVFGGVNKEGNLNDLWSMDETGVWTELVTEGARPEVRHAAACASYDGKLVISTGYFHNDTWILNSVEP